MRRRATGSQEGTGARCCARGDCGDQAALPGLGAAPSARRAGSLQRPARRRTQGARGGARRGPRDEAPEEEGASRAAAGATFRAGPPARALAIRHHELRADAPQPAGLSDGLSGRSQSLHRELVAGAAAAQRTRDRVPLGRPGAFRQTQGSADGSGASVLRLARQESLPETAHPRGHRARRRPRASSADARQMRAPVEDGRRRTLVSRTAPGSRRGAAPNGPFLRSLQPLSPASGDWRPGAGGPFLRCGAAGARGARAPHGRQRPAAGTRRGAAARRLSLRPDRRGGGVAARGARPAGDRATGAGEAGDQHGGAGRAGRRR